MTQFRSLRRLTAIGGLAGAVGLFACTGSTENPANSLGDGSASRDDAAGPGGVADMAPPTADLAPDPYSFGEATPGVTAGPFADLKLFKDGCGVTLYARFIPKQDFALLSSSVTAPDGGRWQLSYSTILLIPQFVVLYRSVQAMGYGSSSGSFPDGRYANAYTVRYPSGSQETIRFDATPESKMYRRPGILDYVSDRMSGSDLYVRVKSGLSGSVYSCYLYDENDCAVGGSSFSSATRPVLVDGQQTEIPCSNVAQAAARYLVVIQGYDSARKTAFYATLDRP